uniref:Secreted protein n=1 Tax=Oreochromis aureus TaxID=47969 RepID=A0AAZ1XYH5_OREAU
MFLPLWPPFYFLSLGAQHSAWLKKFVRGEKRGEKCKKILSPQLKGPTAATRFPGIIRKNIISIYLTPKNYIYKSNKC